jgi:hypothetical protein
MRRLNREEYNNTIRDLVWQDLRPAETFPSDDVGYGFDNIGDVLSISPLLMEKYLSAAETVACAAIAAPEFAGHQLRIENEQLAAAGGEVYGAARILRTNGELGFEYTFGQDGEYLLRARAFGQLAGDEPPKMSFRLDGKDIQTVDVTVSENRPEVYEVRAKISAGKRRVAVAYVNDFTEPPTGDRRRRPRDRNLIVTAIEVQGPIGLPKLLPISHRRIIACQSIPKHKHSDECVRTIVSKFAGRAFRRPATKQEVTRLAGIVGMAQKQGDSFERSLQLAVQAVLVSPHFLFRVELDKEPNNPKAKHPVGQYEMATRLSYFLWSSMPDDELFAVAAKGKLQDPKVLQAQVRRMMKNPRARELAQNFGLQWLQLRRLNEAAPNPEQFPSFNQELRDAMREETVRFFEAVVKEDRSVLDFLDGRFTYLNEPLAKHYGIDGVKGEQFRRVELTGNQRRGVLTHASVLTVTSNPTRTSPVKRGKWVLEQILGTPPPPPPPGVPELEEEKGELKGTLRQRMEQHRINPSCASCHARMDPLGFGLENFDAIGRWRTSEGTFPIDSSGELPGGKRFNGPAELIAILKGQQQQFARSFSEKLLTYAIGRGLESYDNCNVDEIGRRLAENDYRFSALVTEVVLSEPFRMRRGDGGQK